MKAANAAHRRLARTVIRQASQQYPLWLANYPELHERAKTLHRSRTRTMDRKPKAYPSLNLETLRLRAGSHTGPEDGFCVMEAVAYIAGEPWSCYPKCVSPVIGAFLQTWNDCLNDRDRQTLKRYIPRVPGTKGPAHVELRRAYMALDWLIHQNAPAFLERANLAEDAAALRNLPTIHDASSVDFALESLANAQRHAIAARAGARPIPWPSAWVAVGAATWFATQASGWTAAWMAAQAVTQLDVGAAVGAAAWTAAWASAWVAAWTATWPAVQTLAQNAAWPIARDALQPVVKELQTSARELLEEMIYAGLE